MQRPWLGDRGRKERGLGVTQEEGILYSYLPMHPDLRRKSEKVQIGARAHRLECTDANGRVVEGLKTAGWVCPGIELAAVLRDRRGARRRVRGRRRCRTGWV